MKQIIPISITIAAALALAGAGLLWRRRYTMS